MARVLIVDDEPGIRELLRCVLQEAGHDVTLAADGAQAIAAQRNHSAEVVVCDLFMPNKDGLETITALCREFPKIRIIAVSGGGFGGMVNLLPIAMRLGACAALQKPFSTQQAISAVEGVLRASA